MNKNLNTQNANGQMNSKGQQAPNFGGQQASNFGGQQPPNLWGNDNFEGEEIFSDDNFDKNFQNSGTSDLSGIVDSGNSSVGFNFGQQNQFGGFPQGGMMFGGQGNQMTAPASQNTTATK